MFTMGASSPSPSSLCPSRKVAFHEAANQLNPSDGGKRARKKTKKKADHQRISHNILIPLEVWIALVGATGIPGAYSSGVGISSHTGDDNRALAFLDYLSKTTFTDGTAEANYKFV